MPVVVVVDSAVAACPRHSFAAGSCGAGVFCDAAGGLLGARRWTSATRGFTATPPLFWRFFAVAVAVDGVEAAVVLCEFVAGDETRTDCVDALSAVFGVVPALTSRFTPSASTSDAEDSGGARAALPSDGATLGSEVDTFDS